jgi:hypothetical protein
VLYGIKLVGSYLLGTDIAGRNLMVLPDDAFIVSYPRSGNTWTRFLIANLMHPNGGVTFANIESLIPDATALSNKALKRVPRPRLIKSHEYFEPRFRKVVYLVRDPRDVALSLYDFRRKCRSVADTCPIEQYVSERFVPGDLDVPWGEHVGSWLGTRTSHPGFLLVRYEDLQQDTSRELRRMANHLGLAASAAALTQAVEKSAANRLRAAEKAEHEQWITTRGRRADVPFIAQAVVGSWRQRLPQPSVALIESAWGDLMNNLGYQTSTPPAANLHAVTA